MLVMRNAAVQTARVNGEADARAGLLGRLCWEDLGSPVRTIGSLPNCIKEKHPDL